MEILEIEIQTDDLLETENFYSGVLGLQLASKGPNSISFLAGQSTLTFIKSNKVNPKYHFAFNIPHNKLEEAITWAASKLNLIQNSDNGIVANFESWNARAIYFYDNNNNILELIARFDLYNSTDKPFDISSFLSISEIGIVTDEPIKLADKLIENYSLNYFSKGSKSESFATIGDDNGLFIIVKTNRNWFPTEQKSEKHFIRIRIATNGLTKDITLIEDNVSR
jgi:catechol-2,3-dioxygenase